MVKSHNYMRHADYDFLMLQIRVLPQRSKTVRNQPLRLQRTHLREAEPTGSNRNIPGTITHEFHGRIKIFEAIDYWANWKQHGKAAGPIRNGLMIEQEQSDVVVAFASGRGTGDLVIRVPS